MTETQPLPQNGIDPKLQAAQAELGRLLVHAIQLENLILFTALAQDWPDSALAVIEDKLERLSLLVKKARA